MATSAGTSKPSDWKSKCRKESLVCVESLLEEDITTLQLIQASDILSRDQYSDVVEERNIVGLCGYPLCPNKLGPLPTQRYKINVKRKQILDITERKKYCSDGCYKSSQYYSRQLSSEPLWTRPPQPLEEKKVVELLPHRSDHSTATDTDNLSNTTDHSNATPDTAHQCTSTVRSLSQDTNIEESISALTISEDMGTCSRNTGAQSKETASEDRDRITTASEAVNQDVGDSKPGVEKSTKTTDSFTKISRAFSTWLIRPSSPCDDDSSAVGVKPVDNGGSSTSHGGVFLPPVHSVHGDQLQWNIFHRQMVASLPKVCAQLKLDLSEAQESITNMASHFKLDRHTIMFRPSEWRVILLLLLIRCGMVGENVLVEQPSDVCEWMQTLHMTHSHVHQLLSMLATAPITKP